MKFLNRLVVAVSMFLALAVAPVYALVPTVASGAVTALVADTTTFIDSLWAIVAVVVVGFVWIKLFRKGANKAT